MRPRGVLVATLAQVFLVCVSCGGPVTPTPPVVVPNDAPKITAISVAAPRVEAGESVTVAAVVTDAETPVGQLAFAWTASLAGTFSGTGAEVAWRPAADVITPAVATITLTVVERYSVPVAGGGSQTRENTVSQTATVNVNNSLKETTNLALSFLGDFANSTIPADVCVRNFTDKCRGKADEYNDIVKDRALYRITGSSFHVEKVELDESRTHAVIWAPCQFTDIDLQRGTTFSSSGVCLMTAVYEPYRWWLCNSNWCDSLGGCAPSFRSRSKRLVAGRP